MTYFTDGARAARRLSFAFALAGFATSAATSASAHFELVPPTIQGDAVTSAEVVLASNGGLNLLAPAKPRKPRPVIAARSHGRGTYVCTASGFGRSARCFQR